MKEDGEEEPDNIEGDETEQEEDTRIEGTTAYLPPEVVMGAIPTTAADSWALGCVMFQCLSGRPPLLELDDDSTRRRIVSFDVKENSGSAVDQLFADSHASSISDDAREMITSLLDRNASERPSMHSVAEMNFFANEKVDIFSLYHQPAHPLDVGSVAPAPNAQWSRRQLSSIWSPQPVAYSVALPEAGVKVTGPGEEDTSPIPEGEEASGSFRPYAYSHLVPRGLARLSEQKVPKPPTATTS